MPATSASGIIDLVRARVDHSSLTDTQCLEFINYAKRTMQRRYPLRWQEALTTAQTLTAATGDFQTFTLPSDLKAIRSIHHIDSGTYRTIQHDADFFGLVADITGATAVPYPVYWSQYAGTGYLFPRLSQSTDIIIFYEKMLADYTSLTATDAFITYAPEVLDYEATAEYYDSIAETDKARIWHAKAERTMQLLLTQHRANEDRERDPTPVTPGRLRSRKNLNSYYEPWW